MVSVQEIPAMTELSLAPGNSFEMGSVIGRVTSAQPFLDWDT